MNWRLMKTLYEIFVENRANQRNAILWEDDLANIKMREYEEIKETILTVLKQMQKDDRERALYRFTSFPKLRYGRTIEENEVIKDIRAGRISLADPMNFNDPMDPLIKVWIEQLSKNPRTNSYAEDINKVMRNFRICSLVGDYHGEEPYKNALMWGHYTGNHTGICIRYRITPEMLENNTDDNRVLLFGDVRYREHKLMSDLITLDNALLAKSYSWQYENETRLIYFTDRCKDLKHSNGRNKKYCSLGGAGIEAIYMGYRINDAYKQAVMDAIRGPQIELYQMEFDMNDITRLVEKRIS